MTNAHFGFVGLGNMGGPMAGRLADAGHQVLCFDVAGTVEKVPGNAHCATSVAHLAAECETVFSSLPDGPAVQSVLREITAETERKVGLYVDLSTIGIDWAQRNAAEAQSGDIEYIDAPVSGGVSGARAGTISIMCAGAADTVESLRPILLCIGGNVFHIGAHPGQSQAMKVLNNFLSGTAMAATSEAIAFGVRAGLDMKTMLDVLNVSSGQNTATLEKFPNRVLTRTYDAGFRVDQLVKDLTLYEQAAVDVGASQPISAAVVDLWRALQQERTGLDISEIYKFLDRQPLD